MNPILDINLFQYPGKKGERYSIEAAEQVLQGLAKANAAAWRLYPHMPRLYQSGTRYQRELSGTREHWKSYPVILKTKRADCDDLSAARVGELIAFGEDPGAKVHIYRTSPKTLHAVVLRSDGTIEDPSRILGMR